jgi:hypothetical protein
MVNCEQLNAEYARLKNTFAKCKVLRAQDLKSVIELIESVANCSGSSITLKTVNGNSLLGTGNVVIAADGTETKVTNGAGIIITGNGSITSPYSIASTITQANGSETKINSGSNITIIGSGTNADPYVINSSATAGEAQVNADWSSISGLSQILNKPAIPSIAGLASESYVNSAISSKENSSNKQNNLGIDGSGIKFPTVDAVNSGLQGKQNTLTNPVTGTGTSNNLAKFNSSGVIGNSSLKESSTGGRLFNGANDDGVNAFQITGDTIIFGAVKSTLVGQTFQSLNNTNSAYSLNLKNNGGNVYFGIENSSGTYFATDAYSAVIYAPNNKLSLISTSVKCAALAGVGTRTVIADASGNLSAITTPAGVGYKVYTALLSQNGTNAPIATVLENTLGGTVVWSRASTGVYTGTLAGTFTTNKSMINISNGFNSTAIARYCGININGASISTSIGGSPSDGQMGNDYTSVEIRVYN